MINVRLDRHSLPHIRLGLAVFRIEGFFLSRQFLAGFFHIRHLWQLCTVQKLIHSGSGRPVSGKLRLMLRQILFTVPGRLITVKHRPGFCVVYCSRHEPGGLFQRRLRLPQFLGQRMKTLYCLFCTGRQRVIVHQIIFPQVLERSSHLFQIVNLGPPFIGRALALCHALLNVYNQIDTTGRSRGLLRELRDRTLPGNHSPDVLGIKTIPEGGCP